MVAWSADQLVLFFGLGIQELLLILLALVFLFGAKKIPEIARGLGKGITEFKRGAGEGGDSKDDDDDKSSEKSKKD